MKKMDNNKINYISFEAENILSIKLIDIIKSHKWIERDTILINCAPMYSGRLTQLINHKLSFLNLNELFETIPLEVPMPNMTQVWSPEDLEFRMFDKYLADWILKYMSTEAKFLFISANPFMDKCLQKIRTCLRGEKDYKFASLYSQEFTADYYIEKIPSENRVLFEWENTDNPNFKTKQI